MTDKPRLIEFAFPLEQASIDSVHEKNVRHGHISSLHIWPARRPLAACRAALIATLLPDPSTEPKPEGMSDADWEKEVRVRRQKLCERIGGKLVENVERKKMPNGSTVERKKKQTEGGILHWIETEPSSGGLKKIEKHRRDVKDREKELEWFRQEIRRAYGGKAPRVLDPFAGGGAIPLEAMRLGCVATAADINPVAWFILKCTLEYPQKLAGKTHALPDFILDDEEFMTAFYKAHPHLAGRTKKTKAQQQKPGLFDSPESDRAPRADLAWHVRAWGRWVLNRARRELAPHYPTYADFEPLDRKTMKPYERQPMKLVPLRDDGITDIDALNRQFSPEYLGDPRNPRWIVKPTVAYLWARTVTCKNCRAPMPLLKTRWLCKTDNKRVLLDTRYDDEHALTFSIRPNVPVQGGNAAQRREHDRRVAAGTMTAAGAACLRCPSTMTMSDIRVESAAGRCGTVLTAVVVAGSAGKEYRVATSEESAAPNRIGESADRALVAIGASSLSEPFLPASTRSISAQLYGVKTWRDLFTARQTCSLAVIGSHVLAVARELEQSEGPQEFARAVGDELCLAFDRLLCFMNVNTRWKPDADSMTDAFSRFSISLLWDFAEANPLGTAAGSYERCNERIATALANVDLSGTCMEEPSVVRASAGSLDGGVKFDAIVTDPPYYQAVSYADLSDFFYTWLRGLKGGEGEFSEKLSPKADEFVQHIRADKDRKTEKRKYEAQMASAFSAMRRALSEDGRLVCVFAHKDPEAWETLVSALISAGFVVTGSWPIQTEMPTRQRGSRVAALSSSVWLVCRKRDELARPGWDTVVLDAMRTSIVERLRQYWDAGIKGPDFVWAATGPALEAYSKHPIIKKANEPGATMSVGEFLIHVRRMVVDFVIGQVLTGERTADVSTADRLDGPTAYYLLHRHDFKMEEAPTGACILYATACALTDHDLEAKWDLVTHVGRGKSSDDFELDEGNEEDYLEEEDDGGSDSGSKIRLKAWSQRKQKSMGFEAPGGQPVPLIDRIHRLMHIWRGGDVVKVDQYLDEHGLPGQELFRRVLQSLIELADGEERSLLESISNHAQSRGEAPEVTQLPLAAMSPSENEE